MRAGIDWELLTALSHECPIAAQGEGHSMAKKTGAVKKAAAKTASRVSDTAKGASRVARRSEVTDTVRPPTIRRIKTKGKAK